MASGRVRDRSADRGPRSPQGPRSAARAAGGWSCSCQVASPEQEQGRGLVGDQGGFPQAVGAEEVAGTVDV